MSFEEKYIVDIVHRMNYDIDPSFLFPKDSTPLTPRPGTGRDETGGNCFKPNKLEAWDSLEVGGFLCSIMAFISSTSSVSYFKSASAIMVYY